MANMAENLLQIVADRGSFNTLALSQELEVDHQKIVGSIKSLQAHGDVIHCEQLADKRWEITAEGTQVAENGSHEAVVYNAIPAEGGILQAELMKTVPNAKIGFSKAMSAGWIQIDKKAEGGPRIFRKIDNIEDKVQEMCISLRDGQMGGMTDQQKADFKKRKLISEVKIITYLVTKGSNFSTTLTKPETELTPEMMQSGSWKEKNFKPYNFDALGIMPASGHLHPLLKVRTQFRQIFLEMGFTEMPTNNYVESSFWNFDALFQPQQHPARDAHDTFFVSDPANAHEFPMEYLERVKEVHSAGGYGSQGYKYDWKIEEAAKNIMRTHTTAVSARMLYKLSRQEIFTPAKYFSIDRVFRNETLDATHLAEFHQIEGLVADYGLTLGDLMGIIQEFFKKLGVPKIRFKPAYNPYTEPSMEIFSYHEGLKKWVEVGNSGVFRPEMLLPMGLPENVSVIAWGLSLERPTMIKYGIDNIRDLFGPKVNLQMIYDNPICILEKHTSPVTADGDGDEGRSGGKVEKGSGSLGVDTMDEEGLKALDLHLSRASYVQGYQASQADTAAFRALSLAPKLHLYSNVARWYTHMLSYGKDIAFLPGTPVTIAELGFSSPGGGDKVTKENTGTTKEDDDDFDLFGSDDEEDAEAERIKQERIKAYADRKAKKTAVVAKSGIVLDIKPWDDQTDMKKVEECVRSIQADGLLWGASKLVPLAYGIKKLQISCVVEDDKIGTDFLEEEITNFEDYVQSVDIAAFNKI